MAARGGLVRMDWLVGDPLQRRVELREVVEALCLRWPERRWREDGDFRV